MAQLGHISFLWSDEVIQEVSKNRIKNGDNPNSVNQTLGSAKLAFSMGEVLKADYQSLESQLVATHSKDRHVLAAASIAGATSLVTFNLNDFDVAEATTHGVQLIHPDAFLNTLLARHRTAIIGSMKHSRSRRTRPSQTEVEFLDRLTAAGVPNFANALSQFIGQF